MKLTAGIPTKARNEDEVETSIDRMAINSSDNPECITENVSV